MAASLQRASGRSTSTRRTAGRAVTRRPTRSPARSSSASSRPTASRWAQVGEVNGGLLVAEHNGWRAEDVVKDLSRGGQISSFVRNVQADMHFVDAVDGEELASTTRCSSAAPEAGISPGVLDPGVLQDLPFGIVRRGAELGACDRARGGRRRVWVTSAAWLGHAARRGRSRCPAAGSSAGGSTTHRRGSLRRRGRRHGVVPAEPMAKVLELGPSGDASHSRPGEDRPDRDPDDGGRRRTAVGRPGSRYVGQAVLVRRVLDGQPRHRRRGTRPAGAASRWRPGRPLRPP